MNKLLFLALTLTALACGGKDGAALQKVQAAQFDQLLQSEKNAQLVDVRTPEEFAYGHLNGAVNYNLQDPAFQGNLARLDKSKPVMVYCAMGSRSAAAAAEMTRMGFQKVYDLEGGINAWAASGKKIVR